MVLHVSTDSLADYEYSRRPLVASVATESADWPVVVLPFRAWAGSGFALPCPNSLSSAIFSSSRGVPFKPWLEPLDYIGLLTPAVIGEE